MAVAFDAAGTVGIGDTSTTLTFSHTCTGSNRALAVGISTPTVDEPTGVTYAAVALTKIVGASQGLPVDGDTATIWASVGFQPASGANNVVVTWGVSQLESLAGSISVTGADQTNCVSNSNKATGTSTTPSVTCTTASGELLFAHVAAIHNGTCAPGTNETELYDTAAGVHTTMTAHGYRQLGSDGGVMAPTLSASSEWGIGVISFKAVGGAAGVVGKQRVVGQAVNRASTY